MVYRQEVIRYLGKKSHDKNHVRILVNFIHEYDKCVISSLQARILMILVNSIHNMASVSV